MSTRRKMTRRAVLKGAGGVALALPILEGLLPRKAAAGTDGVPPFAIFYRQGCGVAAEQNTQEIGMEPERFWPTQTGPLTAATTQDRAVGELMEHAAKLLVVGGVNMAGFEYGDGHARGALQGLTARGPTVLNAGGDSEAAGESIDHRIGAELNPEGRDSLFLYAGYNGGWLGGPCISYRSSGVRRAALHDPAIAYAQMMGISGDLFAEIIARQTSINDLVRGQMQSLMANPKLSSGDQQRLQLHFDSIREPINLSCDLSTRELMTLEGLGSDTFDTQDGEEVKAFTRTMMDIAALAVACGYTRSVAIQSGNGNDGNTRFYDPDTNKQMENYHYISHRRLSHDSNGGIIPGSDLLHHKIDKQFAQTFKHLLDKLEAYELPSGGKLLDCGMAIWHNDNGNGPGHSPNNCPYIIGGSAGGFLKQGQFIEVQNTMWEGNLSKMLNTIGTAAGIRGPNDEWLTDFGDPSLPQGILDELLA